MKKIIHNIPFGFYLGGGERLLKSWNDNVIKNSENYLIYEKRTQNINKFYFDKFKVLEHSDYFGLNSVLKLSKPNVIVEHGIGWDWEKWNVIYADVKTKVVHYFHNVFHIENITNMKNFGIKIDNVISNYYDKKLDNNNINYTVSPLQININDYPFVKRKYNLDKINVGIVGRISDEKIPKEFIKNLIKFSEKNPQFNFRFLGAGLDYLNYFLKEIKDSKRIKYDGFLNPTEINSFYKKIDILLSPSVSESGGYAILEAMSTGLPTIARSTGGLKETVGYGGITAKNNTDKELFSALFKMTKNESVLYNYSLLAVNKINEFNANPKEQFKKLNKFILS